MNITKELFTQFIKQSKLKELFIRLGWNDDRISFTEKIDDDTFVCESIVEKSGFKIIKVTSPNGEIPVYAVRKKLDGKVSKRYREHLLIFLNGNATQQRWHFTLRQPNKPAVTTEILYHTFQDPELLFQKALNIFFSLDEEDKITIVDVTLRIQESFERNAKEIVRKFYREFQQHHRNFLQFIKGIQEEVDKEWYASLMLNRLMFCYFIQKKRFLNSDDNYLQNKLKVCEQKFGKDKFYSFYRKFLLVLFHKGLGAPIQERNEEDKELLGKIPYLNGGLFDEHTLETKYEIEIKDEAFKGIFKFFDEWNWHLDTRQIASGRDINPDVIGYIFEQYINDRAQMGAYYTREDITGYISRNCVIPWLVEETARHYAEPFKPDAEFFKLIKNSGDKYIYPAVKHGITVNIYANNTELKEPTCISKEIEQGIDKTKPDLLERRKHWNTLAPPEVALPTEIWREVMETT